MKLGWIGAGVVTLGLLVWGGLTLKHEMTCRGLETDYLNEASDLRGSAAMAAIGGSEVSKAADTLQNLKLEQMKLTLTQLYTECGMRAGQTAARKGSNVLLGLPGSD